MPLTIECPHCHKRYRVADEKNGSRVRCKECGQTWTLTVASEAAERDTAGASPSPGAAATLPARIGRYELRQRLGAGAFGAVYRAWDPVI